MSRRRSRQDKARVSPKPPQIHMTVCAEDPALEVLEGTPDDLGIQGKSKCFAIRYAQAQVTVWVIGEVSGPTAYMTLQKAIKLARSKLDAAVS